MFKEDTYKTETGGVIYYSTSYSGTRKRNTKKYLQGFYIPEETHTLSDLDLENLQIKDGDFVTKQTRLTEKVVTKIEGYAQIDENNSELIIKPGELYQITESNGDSIEKFNRFVTPGEMLFEDVLIQKLSYIEFINFQD